MYNRYLKVYKKPALRQTHSNTLRFRQNLKCIHINTDVPFPERIDYEKTNE